MRRETGSARRWGWFTAQQVLIFAIGAATLWLVRAFTGKDLHGLRSAPSWTDLASYVGVAVLLVWISARMLRAASAGEVTQLGLRPSASRLVAFSGALLVGLLWNSLPWLVSWWSGDVVLSTDDVRRPFASALALGACLALANAFFEEIVMRAYVMQLWRDRSGLFQVSVSSIAFSLQHFAGEAPTLSRAVYLSALGVVLGCAYAWRRHVYVAAGLHAGYFYASLIPAGRLESGSWFALRGDLGRAYVLADAFLVALAVALLVWLRMRRSREHGVVTRRSTDGMGHP